MTINFSNLATNLTIVSSYRLWITCNNDNLLGNLRRTKIINTNASVLKNIFLNQLIFDWCKTHFIYNDVKLRNQTYYDFQTLNQSCVWRLTASMFKWLTALSWQFHKTSKVKFLYNKLYVEDMPSKIFKVKTNYWRHDPFHFKLLGTFPIVKNNCLQLVVTFLIKDIY